MILSGIVAVAWLLLGFSALITGDDKTMVIGIVCSNVWLAAMYAKKRTPKP